MLLKDIPHEFFNINADSVKFNDIKKYINISLSEDLVNNIMKTPHVVLSGTFGMGKTTIFKYLENRYINEFEDEKLLPIFLQFTIHDFQQIVRFKIEHSLRIEYFTRALLLTIVNRIKKVLKVKNYAIIQEKIKKKDRERVLGIIDEFITKSKKKLNDVQEFIRKNSANLEFDVKFFKANKGKSDVETLNRYSVIPTEIFHEFQELIEEAIDYLEIEKFIFLFDEAFAIYRNYGMELYTLFLASMKGLKSALAEYIELKISILPYPKPPKNTYFRIKEDFYQYTIQYINLYKDDQGKIINFYKKLLFARFEYFKDNLDIESLPSSPDELINQIFERDAWLAIVYGSMGIPRHFFLLLKQIRDENFERKVSIEDVVESMFELANTLEDAIESETNKKILKDLRKDLDNTNKRRKLPNFIFTLFIAYPRKMEFIGGIEELVRNNLLILCQERISFDNKETREKLGGDNYGLLFALNICYGYKEKLFKGRGGGPIGLRNLTNYFQYLNLHSSSKKYRSKIRDFIPGQEIIDEDEFLPLPRDSKDAIIKKAKESLEELLAETEEIKVNNIETKEIIIDSEVSLPAGYKTTYKIIKKIVFKNGVNNKSLDDLQDKLRYHNAQMTSDIELALRYLMLLYENEYELFSSLWLKNELQHMAMNMGLAKSGKKSDISFRIIKKIEKNEVSKELAEKNQNNEKDKLKTVDIKRDHSNIKSEFQEFWIGLLEKCINKTDIFKNRKTSKDIFVCTRIEGFVYCYAVQRSKKTVSVELYIDVGDKSKNKAIFEYLIKKKDDIEKQFGDFLIWKRLDERRASRIVYSIEEMNWNEKKNWPIIQDIMIDNMIKLNIVLQNYTLQIEL